MSDVIRYARSFLFLPGTRLAWLEKAMASGSDIVILDLEDAVPAESKVSARQALAERLPALTPPLISRLLVRINGISTQWHQDDVAFAAAAVASGLGAVVLPKAEDERVVRSLVAQLGPKGRVVALIESLAGLDHVDAIAREPGLIRLAFGHLDFQLDVGMHCTPEEPELTFARAALVASSRRAGLPAPIDGVTTAIHNEPRLVADTLRSRAYGFGGKLCIHPAQVAEVNQRFIPSSSEVSWAREVIAMAAQHGDQAFTLNGKMVDRPVFLAAQAVVLSTRLSNSFLNHAAYPSDHAPPT